MDDRFTRGFISGVIAGILPLIFNFTAFTLNFTTVRWAGFAGIFLFGHKPHSLGEEIFAVIAVFFFLGLLGIIFSLLIPFLSRENLLLKSSVFGLTVWFASFAITFLFQLPDLEDLPLLTVITNFISAILWGLTLGVTFDRLTNRIKNKVDN